MDALTEIQVFAIGLMAMALASGINLYSRRVGKALGRKKLTLIVAGAGFGLALAFAPQGLPSLPNLAGADPLVGAQLVLGWLGSGLQQLSAVVGFATLVYNLLYQEVQKRLETAINKGEIAASLRSSQ